MACLNCLIPISVQRPIKVGLCVELCGNVCTMYRFSMASVSILSVSVSVSVSVSHIVNTL